ncbi:MAG TPA: hypothetical protein VG275_07210 [Solirubrobacteraceae bacterium]|nr:hypothetical protein [Solirubrobacteraceae bacterium]
MTTPAPLVLLAGDHDAASGMYCFTEAVAYAAGEPHSSSPKCLSPVIRRFGMALNDRLDDDRRQLLRPFALRALGTAGDGRDEERREMCTQWLLEHLPDLFDRAGLPDTATKLRAIEGDLAVENVRRVLLDARDDAWAARSRALDLVRARVRDELRKQGLTDRPAEAAVAEAAVAAVAEAVAVAEAAAEAVAAEAVPYSERWWQIRDAVYLAVRAKVREILAPTLDELLPSALDLLDRMLPPEPLQAPAIPNAEILFAAPGKAASS